MITLFTEICRIFGSCLLNSRRMKSVVKALKLGKTDKITSKSLGKTDKMHPFNIRKEDKK